MSEKIEQFWNGADPAFTNKLNKMVTWKTVGELNKELQKSGDLPKLNTKKIVKKDASKNTT